MQATSNSCLRTASNLTAATAGRLLRNKDLGEDTELSFGALVALRTFSNGALKQSIQLVYRLKCHVNKLLRYILCMAYSIIFLLLTWNCLLAEGGVKTF